MKYHAYFDASSCPIDHKANIGGVIFIQNKAVYKFSKEIKYMDNNLAEYEALIYLLKNIIKKGIKNVNIYGDSRVVINQMQNLYNQNMIIGSKYIGKFNRAKFYADKIKDKQFHWIPRDFNFVANRLSLKYKRNKKQQDKTTFKISDLLNEKEIEEITKLKESF